MSNGNNINDDGVWIIVHMCHYKSMILNLLTEIMLQ